MKDLKLACVLTLWERSKIPHPLYMWALIDISTGRVVKFFLFYKNVKFNNITRKESGLKIVREWIEEKRKELQLSPGTKGEFLIKRYKQENSQQIKQFVDGIGDDFRVTYVDNLAFQGLPWGDTLLETLCDLGGTTEQKDILLKMQTLPLSKEDIVSLRKVFTEQVQRFHLPFNGFSEKPEGKDKRVDKLETSSQFSLVTPDLGIAPNAKRVWLKKIGEKLEECVSCEDDVMSHKPIREAWAEAVKIKRTLEKEIAASYSQIVSSQETMLEKQDVAAEKVERLTDIVQDIKDHLQKKREKKAATKPLTPLLEKGGRDEIKYELYQALMNAPSPR